MLIRCRLLGFKSSMQRGIFIVALAWLRICLWRETFVRNVVVLKLCLSVAKAALNVMCC